MSNFREYRDSLYPGLGGATWSGPNNTTTIKYTPVAPTADDEQLAKLRERRRVYIEYARHRIDDEDWHGVSDAANDLRELDCEIRMLATRRG